MYESISFTDLNAHGSCACRMIDELDAATDTTDRGKQATTSEDQHTQELSPTSTPTLTVKPSAAAIPAKTYAELMPVPLQAVTSSSATIPAQSFVELMPVQPVTATISTPRSLSLPPFLQP